MALTRDYTRFGILPSCPINMIPNCTMKVQVLLIFARLICTAQIVGNRFLRAAVQVSIIACDTVRIVAKEGYGGLLMLSR
jgi:hypothetical protein